MQPKIDVFAIDPIKFYFGNSITVLIKIMEKEIPWWMTD